MNQVTYATRTYVFESKQAAETCQAAEAARRNGDLNAARALMVQSLDLELTYSA